MFYSITGNVVYFDAQCVAIDCNGVAFKCFATTNTLKNVAKTGEKVTLFTYLSVKEDALDLYGFYTQQELECYKILISVSGVGAKMALAVLSEMTPEQLALSIAAGDTKAITRANGVGNKIAQRIVLELKDKLAKGLDLQSVGTDIARFDKSGNLSTETFGRYFASTSGKKRIEQPKVSALRNF